MQWNASYEGLSIFCHLYESSINPFIPLVGDKCPQHHLVLDERGVALVVEGVPCAGAIAQWWFRLFGTRTLLPAEIRTVYWRKSTRFLSSGLKNCSRSFFRFDKKKSGAFFRSKIAEMVGNSKVREAYRLSIEKFTKVGKLYINGVCSGSRRALGPCLPPSIAPSSLVGTNISGWAPCWPG